ncbi:MAG: T9SS type A sorting domain-containing protein [Cyclobacteriaceae bacterium]
MAKAARQRVASNNMYDEEVPAELTVFPNPTSYWLSIRLFTPRKEENLVLIADAMGKIVARSIFGSEEDTMDIGYLLPGIYLVVVTNSNGRWIEKLIVNK